MKYRHYIWIADGWQLDNLLKRKNIEFDPFHTNFKFVSANGDYVVTVEISEQDAIVLRLSGIRIQLMDARAIDTYVIDRV